MNSARKYKVLYERMVEDKEADTLIINELHLELADHEDCATTMAGSLATLHEDKETAGELWQTQVHELRDRLIAVFAEGNRIGIPQADMSLFLATPVVFNTGGLVLDQSVGGVVPPSSLAKAKASTLRSETS